jgi:hypothetical protein
MSMRDRIAKAMMGVAEKRAYPTAPHGEWHGDMNYAATGGRMTTMTPQEYLAQSRPLTIDEVSRENIDLLKQHIQQGGTLDPLALYNRPNAAGTLLEDGRHRANAAIELGIDQVPVLNWRPEQ